MNKDVKLTKRENEVAEFLAWGASKKELADIFCIDYDTVDSHTRAIYEKTDTHKVSELSAWWFCTHFHISFNLSPLKRQIIAFILLLILLPNEIIANDKFVRVTRAPRVKAMKRVKTTRRRNDNELDLTNFFN